MFIGLDLGTTNIKAILTDAAGGALAQAAAPAPLHHVGADGVEQDIEDIWSATLATLRQLGEAHSLSGVQAIGVSSQGGALQPLDQDGNPTGRAISWLDNRGRPFDAAFTQEMGARWMTEHIGAMRSLLAVGQTLRLREEGGGTLAPPHRIGFVGDVIVSRLCGAGAHDATSLSIAGFYNPSLRCTDPDLLQRLGIQEPQLPRLLPPNEPAGRLLDSVAAEAGLPRGIPVSPAVHDQYASALAMGATRDGDVVLGAGTAWVLLAATALLHGTGLRRGHCLHACG